MKTKVIIGVLVLLLVGGIYGGVDAAKKAKVSTTNAASSNTSETSNQKITDPIIDDKEGLQVIVQWMKQENPSQEQIFSITLDNHAVDVDEFQFEGNITVLLDDKEVPIQIEELEREGSGHHLSAELKITSPEFTEISPGSNFTLNVKNVYDTPARSFTWKY
ncbi:hypothetical protein Desdi_1136 [Desulfitobacterium dichloroeliminans LMG P-21439]|uniref:Uncharacterized protein n=1 Tax=Desulfitobacterium dichloroeliminans (strain LMG P-21439 / DCA1) TaxID=871963 RepID=L0F7M3_DESDL|nr:hypothetical protein [Desulfitobacterium dichloroeliminans]AGA68651.1 hypothetical protein Desdi_1136 [Desulfitobacterium dichloroeliminans LMG P-21439]